MARKTITVDTPEWVDRPVTTLRKWNAGEWIDFQAETGILSKQLSERELERIAHPRIVAWSVVDDAGSLAYARPTFETLEAATDRKMLTDAILPYLRLLEEDASVVRRVSLAAVELHNIHDGARAAIEKN